MHPKTPATARGAGDFTLSSTVGLVESVRQESFTTVTARLGQLVGWPVIAITERVPMFRLTASLASFGRQMGAHFGISTGKALAHLISDRPAIPKGNRS